MAKGARASSRKANRSKLRARVFQPVEDARLERLHQKLLETVQQPKPESAKDKEMDVDPTDGKHAPCHLAPPTAHTQLLTCISADSATNDVSKEEDFPKGLSFLTASIPHSLHDASDKRSSDVVVDDDNDSGSERALYHLLGLCSDVVGFTSAGDLKFAFDLPPPKWKSDQRLTVSS